MNRTKLHTYFSLFLKLVLFVSLSAALWIMGHLMGLSENLDFGAGAYYYTDMPGFEKWFNSVPYVSTVPSWLIILLFLGWGILMMKLWLWIDKKNDCGKAGEK